MNLNMLEMLIDEGYNATMVTVGGEEFVEVRVNGKIFWLNYIFEESDNSSRVEVGELARMNCQTVPSVWDAMCLMAS